MSEDGGLILYPHIRGAGVVLPDCSKGIYAPFRLTSKEKRELVRDLAQKGFRGLDDFLSRERTEGAVKDRLEALRKRMAEELARVRRDRRSQLDSEIERLTAKGPIGVREVEDRNLIDDAGFRRYSSERIREEVLALDMISLLEGREAPRERVARSTFFARFVSLLRRGFEWFEGLVGRCIRWLRSIFWRKAKTIEGTAGDRKTARRAASLPFPGLIKDLEAWDSKLDGRLEKDGKLREVIDRRLSERYGYSSGAIALKSSMDPEWYRSKAREVLREDVERTSREAEGELTALRERRLAELSEGRERERKAREEALRLEKAFEEEARALEAKKAGMAREEVKQELVSALSKMGYIHRIPGREGIEEAEGEWEITEALVEKFSELIYSELMVKDRAIKDRRGSQSSDSGVYEKGRLKTVQEENRMDILQTIVNARTNHPREREIETSDMVVLREVSTSEIHAVILLDTSGSMEENLRLEAAKRSVLALSQAVKRENPRNRVDIISVSTNAKPVSLREVLSMEARGFTNHAEGLAFARSIFEGSRADRHLLFMITDGLPEAYTNVDGRPIAGDLAVSMERTLMEIVLLKRLQGISFNIFLLEPKDETYVAAARKMAQAGEGNMIVANPKELAYKVIGAYQQKIGVLEGL